jgi:hypothetical protein
MGDRHFVRPSWRSPSGCRVRELGHDASCRRPAERPQELRIAVLAGSNDLAVGADDLGADERVAGEPAGVHEVADPAGKRQPGDARVDEGATGRGEAVSRGRRVEVQPLAAALCPREASLGSTDRAHVAQVDDERVVGDAVAGDAVPTAPAIGRSAARARRTPRRRLSSGTGR